MAPPSLRIKPAPPAPAGYTQRVSTFGKLQYAYPRKPAPLPGSDPRKGGYWEDPEVPGQTTGNYGAPTSSYGGQTIYNIPEGSLDSGWTGPRKQDPGVVIPYGGWAGVPGAVPVPAPPGAPWEVQGPTTIHPPANPLGEKPNIEDLINKDFEVQGAISNRGSALGTANDLFSTALQRAAVALGLGQRGMGAELVPQTMGTMVTIDPQTGLVKDRVARPFGSLITPETIQNAIANKYSTNQQIQNQQDRAQAQMSAALAGRGLLSSGQLSKSAGDIDATAAQNRFTALQDFLGIGERGLSDIAGQESALDQAIAQARGNAGGRAADALRAWLLAQGQIDNAPTTLSGGDTGGDTPPDTTPLPPEITGILPTAPPVLPGAAGAAPRTTPIKVPKVQHISTTGGYLNAAYPTGRYARSPYR